MGRPRGVAQALALVALRELEQRLDRARVLVDSLVWIAALGEASRHGREREVLGLQARQLVPAERRRDPGVRGGPHRVGRGDRAVLGTLVVVDEHPVALLLPPLAGGERRRAALHVARQRQGGAPHLVEAPAPL